MKLHLKRCPTDFAATLLFLSKTWHLCHKLKYELSSVQSIQPLNLNVSNTIISVSTVVLNISRSVKLKISFDIDIERLDNSCMIDNVTKVVVERIYGPVNTTSMSEIFEERIKRGGIGFIRDACYEILQCLMTSSAIR